MFGCITSEKEKIMSRKLFKGGEYLVTDVKCEDIFVPEDFNDEQRQMADTAEQFVINEVAPNSDAIEAKDFAISLRLIKEAGDLGLLLVDVPEEYDGLELDKTTSMLIAEKLGGQGGSFGLTVNCHTGIGTLPLIYYGTKEQKDKYLGPLASGEKIGAYCLTEPGAGSDAMSGKTFAVLSEDGTHYVLNGTKQFITNGGFADLFTVFAKVDKEHYTGFLVERGFEGLEIGPEEKKMGLNGSSTTQVILTNVKVPVENLLGEIGKGHKIAFNILNIGRLKLGVVCSGMAKVGLREAAGYANERVQFGTKICEFGAIKEKMADMTAAIFSSESLVYRISGMIDDRLEGIEKGTDNYYANYQKGIEEYAAECAMAKVYGSEAFQLVADEALQVFGGYGYISEYAVEGLYRGERLQRIYEGTNEINRMIIPTTLVRRAFMGSLPLLEAAQQAVSVMATPGKAELPGDGSFAAEHALIRNLKTVVTAIYGVAVQTYQKNLFMEQELQLALADISMQLFALESAVLRAEKLLPSASASKSDLLNAVITVCAFDASERLSSAARRAINFIDNEEVCNSLHQGLGSFCSYKPDNLLKAKRALAGATADAGVYLF
jgi:alkylation response protein AidB-like acyl-CoA dehydrogenase